MVKIPTFERVFARLGPTPESDETGVSMDESFIFYLYLHFEI
jgi:hypothetical protein